MLTFDDLTELTEKSDDFDFDDANELLNKIFYDNEMPHIRKTELEYTTQCDRPLRREWFNNWTDSLRSNGQISEAVYDRVCISDHNETRLDINPYLVD